MLINILTAYNNTGFENIVCLLYVMKKARTYTGNNILDTGNRPKKPSVKYSKIRSIGING